MAVTLSVRPSPKDTHVLTLFGKEYPTGNEMGFPTTYYTNTYKRIANYLLKNDPIPPNVPSSVPEKSYLRDTPYKEWDVEKLVQIGQHEFLYNLFVHFNKLILALLAQRGSSEVNEGQKELELLLKKLKPSLFVNAHSDFSRLAEKLCIELNVLTCQVADAILVNALAAIVTMQRGHIKMNEKLYIELSEGCPLAVKYEGDFVQEGDHLRGYGYVSTSILNGKPGADLWAQTAPSSQPTSLSLGQMVPGSQIPGSVNMDEYTEQDENVEDARKHKVQRLF